MVEKDFEKGRLLWSATNRLCWWYKKEFKNSYVLINNIKCELIGEICMDMLMVKISKEAEEKISVGDEVIILNEKIIDDIDVEDFCL